MNKFKSLFIIVVAFALFQLSCDSNENGDRNNNGSNIKKSNNKSNNGNSKFEGLPLPEGKICEPDVQGNINPALGVTFNKEHILCIKVEIDKDDYENLENDTKFGVPVSGVWEEFYKYLSDCKNPWPNKYTWFNADINVDGIQLSNVGIRKKGFLGSAITLNHPSLKFKTDKYVNEQFLGETERITLNNRGKDATHIITCLAYALFAAAEYPAPLCNFANVSVNGELQGAYIHIEAIKKRFLKRAFGDSSGSLYEATLSDFTTIGINRWEVKTDETDIDLKPILNIIDVLNKPDEELIESLSPFLNIDSFITFWALEIILSHGDGYTAKQNNFYVYFNPVDNNRATFIPWSLDSALSVSGNTEDFSSFSTSELSRRFSRIPVITKKLESELLRLIDTVWNEDILLNSIERNKALILTAQKSNSTFENSVDNLKTWMKNRPGEIRDMLKSGFPQGSNEPNSFCGEGNENDKNVDNIGTKDCKEGEKLVKNGITYICEDGKWVEEQ